MKNSAESCLKMLNISFTNSLLLSAALKSNASLNDLISSSTILTRIDDFLKDNGVAPFENDNGDLVQILKKRLNVLMDDIEGTERTNGIVAKLASTHHKPLSNGDRVVMVREHLRVVRSRARAPFKPRFATPEPTSTPNKEAAPEQHAILPDLTGRTHPRLKESLIDRKKRERRIRRHGVSILDKDDQIHILQHGDGTDTPGISVEEVIDLEALRPEFLHILDVLCDARKRTLTQYPDRREGINRATRKTKEGIYQLAANIGMHLIGQGKSLRLFNLMDAQKIIMMSVDHYEKGVDLPMMALHHRGLPNGTTVKRWAMDR